MGISAVPKSQANDDIKSIYETMEKTYGRVPNFFAAMAHRPNVLKHFLPFYKSVTAEGTVEPRYKELAYLKASTLNGCEYCTRAHTAGAKKIGLTDDEIKAIPFYRRSHLFNDKDKATLLYAERVTRGAAGIREGSIEELKKYYTEDQIVELTLVIAVANFTNRVNDALQNEPDLG
ncbi:MAG TPA: carboxymuconolactone decarboxylase family protein [Blastocatellia bacterium]|nr:carboxymuconolactone decarboxylase family protein [Blastocatellia bacterium]